MSALDRAGRNVRYAARSLLRSPTYSGIVVATLALGIAANAVVFSVMNPYLVRELPYEGPEELVQIGQIEPRSGWEGGRFSLPMIRDYRERTRTLEALAAYRYGGVNVADEGRPQRLQRGVVTADLFDLLGVEAFRGRTFLPQEGDPGSGPVVVLDHGLWESRYGGDARIVGRTIRLDGVPHTVVGVMPPEFVFPWNEVKLWTPLRRGEAYEDRGRTSLILVGRLADGRTRGEARRELEAIQGDLAGLHPDADAEFSGISVVPLREGLNFAWEALSVGFPVLLGSVVFVLLIVCVNVASLTLARNQARRRQMAVRAAVGADRRRLVEELLTESGLLGAVGGASGLLLATWAISAIGPTIPEMLFRVGEVTLDARVLAYTVGVALVTPVLFGLLPALHLGATDPGTALRSDAAAPGAGAARQRGRRALVAAEVALALVLVAGAGLMLRSLAAVQQAELGFDPERLLSVEIQIPQESYPSPEEVEAYYRRATEAVASLPGVETAGAIWHLPMNHEMALRDVAVAGREPPSKRAWPLAAFNRAGPGTFAALGVPVLAGRGFAPRDGDDVAVVSESFVRRHFDGANPIGATVLIDERSTSTPLRIVGVVGDLQHADLTFENRPQLYRPLATTGARRRFLVARASSSPEALVAPIRSRLGELDPDLPAEPRSMTEIVRENTFVWSLGSAVLGAFGGFALLLASLGIYGVVAYSVERRRREIGIRIALGATARQVRGMVLGEGVRTAAIGGLVGLVAAMGAGRLMETILFGVAGLDPLALGTTLALFVGVATLSSWLPARRAARSDPARTLRAS